MNPASPNKILVTVLSPGWVYYWTFTSNSVLIPELSQTGSSQNYSPFFFDWFMFIPFLLKKGLSIFISQIQKYHYVFCYQLIPYWCWDIFDLLFQPEGWYYHWQPKKKPHTNDQFSGIGSIQIVFLPMLWLNTNVWKPKQQV